MEVDLSDPASVGTELIRLGTLLRLGNHEALTDRFRHHGWPLLAAALDQRLVKNFRTEVMLNGHKGYDGQILAQTQSIEEIHYTLLYAHFPA